MENAFTQPKYSKGGGYAQLVSNLNFEQLIPEEDSVRLLSRILEEIDYTELYAAYSRRGRKPAISPKNLFKVIIYGAMNHLYSSRKLERACRRDLHFLYLLQGERTFPDHNTIARFKKQRLPLVLPDLFAQFTALLLERKEIQFETLFVDGTKMEANANRYTFVWRKTTEKNEKKMMAKVRLLLQKCFPEGEIPSPLSLEGLEACLARLQQEVADQQLLFVHGKGKRKTPLQRDYEELASYVERKAGYDAALAQMGDDRNSFSKTDPDATFMHMKDDHMRNGQLKPAYNVQIGVEAEYIVEVGISSDRTDYATLIPFLRKVESRHPDRFRNIVADAGYESEENYAFLAAHKYKAFIKPQNHEARKHRKFQKEIGRKENMRYDPERDCFLCQNGRILRFSHESHRELKSGYEQMKRNYTCVDCSNCPLYDQCNRSAKGANKTLRFSPVFEHWRAVSAGNIAGEEGIGLRINRSIQVEGAFGVVKENYHFRRFLTRGKKNVEVEVYLVCLGYNIQKLHNKQQRNRQRTYYHTVKIA